MTDTTKTPGETPEGGSKPETKPATKPEAKAEVYDLEPHVPAPPTARVAKLDAPGLTDDFDEDADFDHDPAMPTAAVPKAPAAPVETFVKAGWGSAQVIGTLGIAAALTATVLAAWLGDGPWYKAVVLSLYHIGLQTMAGVGAVVFAAWMVEKPIGSSDLAAARMLLAVGLARVFLPMTFGVPYTGRFLEGAAVVAAYGLVTWGLFRLPRPHWFVMVCAHVMLMVVLAIGGFIESWAGSAPAAVKPAATPAAVSGG